jgi:hypothetical protein
LIRAQDEDFYSDRGDLGCFPRDRTRLEFGLYGRLDAFGTGSETLRFGFGEGLPSKARAAAIWSFLRISPLQDSSALRPRRQPGLTCAAALPVFAGEFLMAGGGVFSAATTTRIWVLATSGITATATSRAMCAHAAGTTCRAAGVLQISIP